MRLDMTHKFIDNLLLPSCRPFGGTFEVDDENGVAKPSFMTYDHVVNFSCRSRDQIIDDIPLADGEPVHQDTAECATELVFGRIGTKAIGAIRLSLDGDIIGGHGV